MGRLLDLDEAKKNPDWEIVFSKDPRVNAGDVACVLWESPFTSAYQAWGRKTGKIPKPEQTEAMAHGNVTEPLIFDWFCREKKITGVSQAWAIHDELPWLQGKADFWNAEERILAEFKAPSKDDSADHTLAKNGEIPYHYWLQCQALMETFDVNEMYYVSWRSPEDAVTLAVERNSDFWLTEVLPYLMDFIERVRADAWPKPEGTVVEVSEEWAMHARRLLEAKAMVEVGRQNQRRAEAAIKRMATAKVTKGGGIRATWTTYRPRWEVVVSADSEAARDKIATAVNPLAGKQGVGKITNRTYPPNLILRISEDGKA